MEEIWKDIKGYEGSYQVSNLGRVKSVGRLIERNGTEDFYYIKERIRKPIKNNRGYLCVMLSKHCLSKGFQVHRLVAQAFIPNPDNLPQVNHKDENKENNCVDNLEWCTNEYNRNYSNITERTRELQGVSIDQFTIDGQFIKTHRSIAEAANEVGVNKCNIQRCLKKKSVQCKGFIWKYHEKNDY